MLTAATKYIVGLFAQNEAVQALPRDFITSATLWARSWLLTDDATAEVVITSDKVDDTVKEQIITKKLEDLKTNETFMKELAERLAEFERQKAAVRHRNTVEKGDFEAEGNIRVGNEGQSDNSTENSVKDSKFKAGRDIIVGDTHNHDTHNHYHQTPPAKPNSVMSLQDEVRNFIRCGETQKAIDCIIDARQLDSEISNDAHLLSSRLQQLERQKNKGIITHSEADVLFNNITAALAVLCDRLPKA